MFKLWLEWDMGQDGSIFSTKDKAIQWVNAAVADDSELQEEFPNGYNDLADSGLCYIEQLNIDPTY